MASEEHKKLAKFLKDVHTSLRDESKRIGAEEAWRTHCQNKSLLRTYARYMEKLATDHWIKNSVDEASEAFSRIVWAENFCKDYFLNGSFSVHREKDIAIAKKINMDINIEEVHLQPIKLIDVGSCYNPFNVYEYLDVTAIDLCPANDSVLECDFLVVPVGSSTICSNGKVEQLQTGYFDVVTFCFLLEYIPTSELRIKAVEKAWSILNPGGLLIINTPDSKHVGANSKIMKTWQYTLACLGFTRIKYEKLKHMHCMVFRKALSKETAVRWALLRKEQMEHVMHIPQDFNISHEEAEPTSKVEISLEDFNQLPFCEF